MENSYSTRAKGFTARHEAALLKHFLGDKEICTDATIQSVVGKCRGARARARELSMDYLKTHGEFVIPDIIVEPTVE